MKCNTVEKLVAMFVEDDLDRETASNVGAHIESCRTCAELAEEFRRSQQWLRKFDPPAFDPDSFVDSRRAVLQLITARQARPRLLTFFKREWSIAQAVAAVAVLALLATAALILSRHNRTRSQAVAESAPEQQDNNNRQDSNREKDQLLVRRPPEHMVGGDHAPRRRHANQPRAARIATAPLAKPFDPPIITDTHAVESAGINERETTEEESMLRIEIQTSDPSVRIIWFAPKPAEPVQRPDW